MTLVPRSQAAGLLSLVPAAECEARAPVTSEGPSVPWLAARPSCRSDTHINSADRQHLGLLQCCNVTRWVSAGSDKQSSTVWRSRTPIMRCCGVGTC